MYAFNDNPDDLSLSQTDPVTSHRPIRVDSDGAGYRISGMVWCFGQADSVKDEIMPGAISGSLAVRGIERVRMLFQHDPTEIIGRWLSIYETEVGIFAEGEISLSVQRGQELAALIDSGGVDGLSIGFQTCRAQRDPVSGHRQIFALDLWEISLVAFPMLESARLNRIPAVFPTSSSALS